jgi:hypothetical protein
MLAAPCRHTDRVIGIANDDVLTGQDLALEPLVRPSAARFSWVLT